MHPAFERHQVVLPSIRRDDADDILFVIAFTEFTTQQQRKRTN